MVTELILAALAFIFVGVIILVLFGVVFFLLPDYFSRRRREKIINTYRKRTGRSVRAGFGHAFLGGGGAGS
jgi:hypothetical protein